MATTKKQSDSASCFDVLYAIDQRMKGVVFTARGIAAAALDSTDDAFRDAVAMMCGGKPSPTKIQRWLEAHIGRCVEAWVGEDEGGERVYVGLCVTRTTVNLPSWERYLERQHGRQHPRNGTVAWLIDSYL